MAETTQPINVFIKSEKTKEPQEIKQLNKAQELFEGFSEQMAKKFKIDFKDIGAGLADKIYGAFTKGAQYLYNRLQDAWEELGNMVDYSLLSNEHTRDLTFSYGFSAAQAYGFDKAKELMGIRNDEDLYYMNQQQTEKFQEMMMKYAEKYTEMYDSGMWEKYLDFQYEWAEFKQGFLMDFIGLIMDNKDLIINTMEGILWFTEGAMNALNWLVSRFGGNKSTVPNETTLDAMAADILNYDNRSNSTTINMDNTYNHISQADQSWLSSVGQMTYEQIEKYLRVNVG